MPLRYINHPPPSISHTHHPHNPDANYHLNSNTSKPTMHLIIITTALTTLLAVTALAKKPNKPAPPPAPPAIPPVRIATHLESSCTQAPGTVFINPNACLPFPDYVKGLQVFPSSDEHVGDQSSKFGEWMRVDRKLTVLV
jgi:hypothetical protein